MEYMMPRDEVGYTCMEDHFCKRIFLFMLFTSWSLLSKLTHPQINWDERIFEGNLEVHGLCKDFSCDRSGTIVPIL